MRVMELPARAKNITRLEKSKVFPAEDTRGALRYHAAHGKAHALHEEDLDPVHAVRSCAGGLLREDRGSAGRAVSRG